MVSEVSEEAATTDMADGVHRRPRPLAEDSEGSDLAPEATVVPADSVVPVPAVTADLADTVLEVPVARVDGNWSRITW